MDQKLLKSFENGSKLNLDIDFFSKWRKFTILVYDSEMDQNLIFEKVKEASFKKERWIRK